MDVDQIIKHLSNYKTQLLNLQFEGNLNDKQEFGIVGELYRVTKELEALTYNPYI